MPIIKYQKELRYVNEYSAIQYTGDNAQEILDFVNDNGFNCNNMEKPVYRPKNFKLEWGSWDCLKFWKSLDLHPELRLPDDKCQFHNSNSFPDWNQYEEFYIIISTGDRFCSRQYFKKNDWLVYDKSRNKMFIDCTSNIEYDLKNSKNI